MSSKLSKVVLIFRDNSNVMFMFASAGKMPSMGDRYEVVGLQNFGRFGVDLTVDSKNCRVKAISVSCAFVSIIFFRVLYQVSAASSRQHRLLEIV